MKNFKFLLFILLALPVVLLSSCDKDEGPRSYALVTVKILDGDDYYFLSDKGNKIYPGDKSLVNGYQAKEGQRAFVYFDELPEQVSGYNYNAKVHYIENILTKEVSTMNEEQKEDIGDSKVAVAQASVAGGYLTLEIAAPAYYTSCKLSLVENLADPQPDFPDNDEYTYLEFRAKAEGPEAGPLVRAYVSFRLDEYDPAVTGKKGLRIRVNSPLNDIYYLKVDAATTENPENPS